MVFLIHTVDSLQLCHGAFIKRIHVLFVNVFFLNIFDVGASSIFA